MIDWTPRPPALSDKLADWEVLAAAGGEALVSGKVVVECGPEWGVDALALASRAKLWLLVDGSAACLDHLGARRIPGARMVVPRDLTQPWDWAPEEGADLVLDFSTFDDSSDPLACYRSAVAALAPGGVLVSTFANAREIRRAVPFQTQDPAALSAFLAELGAVDVRSFRRDQPRAGVVARRPS